LAFILFVNVWVSHQTIWFQSFNWNDLSNRGGIYNRIQSSASDWSNAGANFVWFPTPSQSADAQGYMPGEWYNLVSSGELQSAITAVRNTGMGAICDIVVNHRTASSVDGCTKTYTVFSNPNGGNNWVVSNDYECNSGNMFCPGGCGCGGGDTGQNFCPAPDIDHSNSEVQTQIINWLNWLKGKGFNGWRFDFAVGYAAQFNGKYVAATGPSFSVGEYWDGNTDNVANWVRGTGGRSKAFDFPLRESLKNSINGNNYGGLIAGQNPPGVMGVMPGNAATFISNHDTIRLEPFGSLDAKLQGYAYILTHPGSPGIFIDDWNNANSQIRALMNIRRQKGLSDTGPIYIDQHTGGLYSAYLGSGAGKCSGNVAMKLGSNSWQPCGSGWNLATSGNNYAVWTK